MPAFKKVKKSTGGKPIPITEELIANICNSMRAGAYIETAAAFAGIHKDTLFDWFKKGRQKPNGPYGELIRAVDKAMADCVMRDLLNIDKCAMGREAKYAKNSDGSLVFNERGNPIKLESEIVPDWSASAWRLERRNPHMWSRVQKLEVDPMEAPKKEKEETEEQKQERRTRLAEKIKRYQSLDDE